MARPSHVQVADTTMPFSAQDTPYDFWTAKWNAVPAVYGICNDKRQVIYIGETDDLSRRMSEHRSNTWHTMHLYGPALVWAEVTPGGNEVRVARQNVLIQEYQPPCNVQGMPSRR
jgi:hypothetical protein